MDDVLAALKAEVNQSDDTEHGLLATDDTDTSTRNVDFATTTTSSGEDHDAHDDNDILVHMQSLDDSGHSLSSTAPPPRDVSPCTFAGAVATEMDIDHHIDTIEEVVVHDTIDVEVISTVTALYSPAKAVLSTPVEPNEQDEMFHDQEVTRVLTTLESAKEREVASSPQEGAVVDETTAEMAEYMESVSNEDNAALLDTSGVSEKSNAEDVQELARRQLANMSSTKKRSSAKASNVIRNMKSRLAHRIETNNTPNNHKTNIKFESHGGTIEIPKELILGSEELHSSVLLSSGTPLKNEDLLAILEGSDDEVNGDAKVRAIPGCLDKEMEKKLALQQMISLPSMPKGRRPKPKTVVEEKATKKPTAKKAKTNELVNSLVMDWSGGSDSESKSEEVEVAPQKKLKPLPKKLPVVGAKADAMAVAPITFKRSRIIKKKIIWDPDAPETAVSYASLIQPSAAFIKKTQSNAVVVKSTSTSGDNPPPRILNKIPAQIQQQEEKELLLAAKKRNLATPSPNALKKRKISELDRLLGDEGAVNMLNALKQETNLTDSSDKETTPDTSITVADRRRKTTAAAATSPAVEEKYNPRQPRIKQQSQTPQANAQQPKKDGAAAIKRKKAAVAAASNSWDYIYSKRDEEALIIRRRSNSSYSSSASNNRLSIDGPTPPAFAKSAKAAAASTAKPVRPRTRETATTFEFAKPNARKSVTTTDEVESTILMDIRPKVVSPKSGTTPSSTVHSRRQAVARATSSSATSDDGSESSVSVEYKPTPKEKKPVVAAKLDAPARPTVTSKSSAKSKAVYQEIRLDRDNGVAHIELAPFSDKLENVFTLQVRAGSHLASGARMDVLWF